MVLIGTKKDMRTDPELLRRLADKGLAPITTAQGTRLCSVVRTAHSAHGCSRLLLICRACLLSLFVC